MKNLSLLFAALAAAVISGCSSTTGVPPPTPTPTPAVAAAAAVASGQGAAKLENTYWKLVELGGKPVKADSRREPHLRLNPEGKAAQGSGGCNTFRGGYQLDGESLRLTSLISTRMACPDLEVEGTFLKALEAATSYKLAGEKLELYADGKLLARFEPR